MSKKIKRAVLTFTPAIAAILCLVLREQLAALSHFAPKCWFHAATGLWCPGCGNTRAARELLSFNFINALRYNISLPICILFGVLLYAEYVIGAWIKPVKIMPRKGAFYVVIGILFFIYCVVRNIHDFMPA